MDMLLDHERLEVYQVSREFSREVAAIIAELPRGAGEPADNLRRATASITRNIAEAWGRATPEEKAHYLHIARGSTAEASASLTELVDFGFTTADRVQAAKTLAWRIISMLVGLIRAQGIPIGT